MISLAHRQLITFTIIFSLFFCCGGAWHTMLFENDTSMNNHAGCGMGDVGSSTTDTQTNHTYSIVSPFLNLLKDMTAPIVVIFSALILLSLIVCKRLYSYFKTTRDRYGGFRLFSYFLYLFRQGILHPKTF